ncbi:MAG: hypothetical protein K8Q89_10340 [Nitrosarchaeum sp.]|nr:hypothetical protein [Nitrosarchaeum sp.]
MKTRFLIIVMGILSLSLFIVADNSETRYAYGGCAATILPQPCFDSFSGSNSPLTQRGIMEDYARNIELNFGDWQMSDRKWDNENTPLQLPAIICTEFVVDGVKQYRMAKWVDAFKISSFEDHRNDFLCDKWLAPIDDGIKVKWDKPNYFSNDTGIIQVTDKDMNLDHNKIDSFVIHVWSDTDHNGIQLTVTETDESSGIFESKVFFTVMGESSGTTLLVEDAVWAEHKSNVNFSKIIDESETEPTIDAFDRRDKLPWYFIIVAYWPAVVVTVGIIITVVFIWRKRK